MTIVVSRVSIAVNGQKPCSRCGRRPRKPGQRYCKSCHAEYMRQWRKTRAEITCPPGMIPVALSPAEWAAIQEARAEPRGRHHAPDPG